MKVIRLFAKSFQFLGEARGRYLLGVALGACELALLFATPTINQMLIDIVTGERQGNVVYTLLGMLAVFLLLVPPVVAGRYLQATAASQGSAHLRKKLFRHILAMPVEEQSKFKAGDFLTRLTDDVNRTTEVFASFSVQQLIRFVVVFTATLVLLLVHDWRIALAGVAYGAINLALSLRLNPYAKSLEADAKTEVVRSASFLMEAIRGIPIVRVFTLAPVLGERYRRICECIREKRMKYRTVIGITYGVVDFFSQSAQAVGFLLGVLLAGDEVSLGQAVFNATLMGMMADSVYRLSTFLLLIQPNLVGMERVFHLLSQPVEATVPQQVLPAQGEAAVELRDVWFRYERDGADVLRGTTLIVPEGSLFAVVGGNGTGKSTMLRAICGVARPYRGKITVFGRRLKDWKKAELFRGGVAMLPQDPLNLMVKKTVRGDLEEMLDGRGLTAEQRTAAVREVAALTDIVPLLDAHPFDLSGGEVQRAALAKVLLNEPRLLLLDEPTKGLDAFFKEKLAALLRSLTARGTTVLMVSHDIEFCASYADRCALFFDGDAVTTNPPRRFFASNSFYTTAANRISRGLFENAVTVEEVVELCRS